jgi:serine/threonine-protein kinase
MKYMVAGSLADHLDEYRDGPDAALLIEKVARAVHYLHGMSILHRDLKPHNILLDDEGEPAVSDFGIAKLVDDELELTVAGAVLGTRPYMAPEQAAGRNKEVGPAADVWALGVILYELVTGRRPFVGKTEHALTQAILSTDPPTPRSLQPRLSADLETIALKCLRKEPAERYASAEALADDLAHWRNQEPITARPESVLRKGRRAIRRHPAVTAAAVLLTLAVGLAVAIAPRLDPDRARREIESRLSRGEAVTLVGETGPPRWYRWSDKSTVGAVPPNAPDEPFQFHSLSGALLVLAEHPGSRRYRLQAEVRHDTAKSSLSQAGVFFCLRHPMDGTGGPVEDFFTLSYSEADENRPNPRAPGEAPRSWLTLYYWRHSLRPGSLFPTKATRHDLDFSFVPFPHAQPSPWRSLAVEVSPNGVAAFWDGQRVGTSSRPIDPDGPLGLFGYNSLASFRNVVLQPFPDEPPPTP